VSVVGKHYDISHRMCGKLIVATAADEVSTLHSIYENGVRCGLKDLQVTSVECIVMHWWSSFSVRMHIYMRAYISHLRIRYSIIISSILCGISSISRYCLKQTSNTWSLQCKQWWVSTPLPPASATAMDSWVDTPKTSRTTTLTSSVTAKYTRYISLMTMNPLNGVGKTIFQRIHARQSMCIIPHHITSSYSDYWL